MWLFKEMVVSIEKFVVEVKDIVLVIEELKIMIVDV